MLLFLAFYSLGAITLAYGFDSGIKFSPSEDLSFIAFEVIPMILLIVAGAFGVHYIKHVHGKKHGKAVKALNKAVLLVSIAGPLSIVPQIIDIWVNKNVSGVSTFSWIAFIAFGFVWIGYGIIHRDKYMIFSNVFWIILEIFLILGVWVA